MAVPPARSAGAANLFGAPAMLKFIAPERGTDRHGSGAWQARRGKRRHRGIDYAAPPGAQCLAVEAGTVTKLGYAYRDDLSYRYVEVTDALGYRARYFFVHPIVRVGAHVMPDDPLGTVQSLDRRYPGITEHVHFEVWNPDGERIHPETYMGKRS